MAILNGIEREQNAPSRTQVYEATHIGEQYSPYMNRSFISFSYGGKNIEDFNLLATINGDRLQRDAYSSFDDLTTTYDALHGQFYWGTYYRTNSLSLTLATDGITQVELDDFRHWFQPGKSKELILSEHPNRAIIARVSQPPQLSLLPFEKKITIPLPSPTSAGENQNYYTSTTLYKGEIQLEFVMDEPFWYAKKNILGSQNVLQGYYSEEWVDANGQVTEVRNNKDALKIIYEDHIPLGSTTNVSVFLGGNVFASIVYRLNSYIVEQITQAQYEEGAASTDPEIAASYFDNGDSQYPISNEYYFPHAPESVNDDLAYNKYYKGAVIATLDNDGETYISGGRVGGTPASSMDDGISTIGTNNEGVTLYNSDTANLYYSGTAPSPLKIKFQLTPIFNGGQKITSPWNKATVGKVPYNTIIFKATKEHHFNFSLPSFYSSYNQLIEIIDQFVVANTAWLTIREYIRDLVKHPIVRAWANCIINHYDTAAGAGIVSSELDKDELKQGMRYLFCNGSGETLPARFEFDGKTGKAKGTFTVRDPKKVTAEDYEDFDASNLASGSENLLILVEDVGDMVKSNYLILDERNVLDDSFKVQGWTESHPDYAYQISHNLDNSLEHVQFEFKNLYL